jgi:hypothetical protein
MKIRELLVVLSLLVPAASVAQTAPDKTLSESENELLKTADEIAVSVGEFRGLKTLAPIKKGIKERSELREVLLQKLNEEVSDDDIAAEGKVYKRLGLVPQDLNYKEMLLDVLTEQIAGFYDQKTKELYVMRGIPMSLQRPAMAHELFHAIQDQHFSIDTLQAPFTALENGDYVLARGALIEGDATIVMIDFALFESNGLEPGKSIVDNPMVAGMLKTMSFENLSALESLGGAPPAAEEGEEAPTYEGSALAKAPAVFREMLMFPYFAGMRFVVAARIGRTWKDVDAIYQNPPSSTEHILHPEKYFAGDEPTFLEFNADAALPEHTKIYNTVMGEFMARLFFKEHLGDADETFVNAAKGWGGDRLIAYEKDGKTITVQVTNFDSWKDAEEYRDALTMAVKKRFPEIKTNQIQGEYGEAYCFLNGDERIYVERWGDLVLHIEGTPTDSASGRELDETTSKIREEVYSTLKRSKLSEEVARLKAK